MLHSLAIRNVVLIDKLDLNFKDGLSVFTGETGAGKSILLDSLSLVLGARDDSGLVRHGQNQLSVSAVFQPKNTSDVYRLLSEHDIYCEDSDEIILKRIVTQDGKSKAYINDEPVSVSFLKTVGDLLVEIHGQFSSHQLLNPATHIAVLDSYAQTEKEKETVKQNWLLYKQALFDLNKARENFENSQKQEAYLRAGIEDLEKLNPQVNEEEDLIMRRNQLMNSEKVITAINQVNQLLNGEQNGVLSQLAIAERCLGKVANFDAKIEQMLTAFNEAQIILSDISGELENIGETFWDISELPEIDNRLFSLRDMSRRYHVEINELPGLLSSFYEQINQLEKCESEIDVLKQKVSKTYEAYLKSAKNLSLKRQKEAKKLDKAVMNELPALKLEKATFITQIISDETSGNETGIDNISFLASTNKGVPPSALNKIASGGELSRFMLALKVNLAHTSQINTLVFDEVDSGVGGATAAAVGERLSRLGTECQVLVVTHSPQVASCGQNHWHVKKSEQEEKTITTVVCLEKSERLTEIARMLSGECISETAQIMAQELLDKTWKTAL